MAKEAGPRTRQPRKVAGAVDKPAAVARKPAVAKKARTKKAAEPGVAKKAVPAKPLSRPPTLRGPALASGRAGAPEIMVTLNSEHRYIASLLEALAEQADNLLPGRSADYGLMYDIVHYMSSFPDEYHHPREDLVFERLVMRDPDAKGAVEELLEGHREINRRSRELVDHLERITRQGATADNAKIKYLCDRYIGHYWEHINTEEGKVFPRATAKLRQEDWFAVNSGAKYVDDPLFGSRVKKEYQRLSQYLSDRVVRVTEDIAVAELFGIEALIEAVAALGSAGGELQDIMRSRLGQAVKDSRKKAKATDGLFGLPRAMVSTGREQARAGAREMRDVIARTRAELTEPFATRVKFLRKLVRD